MSSRDLGFVVHPFVGGLDLSSAPTALVPGGVVAAENCEYNVHLTPDGSPPRLSLTKRLGTARYNATAITGAPTVTALGDFWRFGTSITPTQKFVATAGTSIWKDDLDGVWDEVLASWGSATTWPSITIAQGYAVFTNNNNDIPQKWDQTTVTALTTSLVRFEACSYHLRRLWTVGEQTKRAGDAAIEPSRSIYTAAGDITDFSGGDTGNFVLDEDDGDRLLGVSPSFHGRLYFFKGPNFGSVHEISGTTPSTFSRIRLFSGAPCVSHRSIVSVTNDIFWASRYGIHSLLTTQKYGDTEEFFVSRRIQKLFNTINFARANQIVGFSHPRRNIVGWSIPTGSSTTNDTFIVYNVAVGAWTVWTHAGFDGASVMVGLTPSTALPRLYIGGYDGFVRAADQNTLTDDGASTAYTMRVRTPNHLRLDENTNELTSKVFSSVASIVRPTGSYTANITATVGTRSHTGTVSLNPGSSDLIGSTFIMGTSVMGSSTGTSIAETIIDGADQGRGVQVTWEQGGANQDFELYGYGVRYMRTLDEPFDVNQ